MDNLPIPPEQNLEQPVPPLPKINPLYIFGGLFIMTFILTGGIFIGRYLNTSQNIPVKEIVPTPTLYPSPTVTSIPDPTANWKTYMDGRFNFSVKYPGEWNTLPFPDNWEPGAWLILAYSSDSKTSSIEGKISGVVEGQSTAFMVSVYNKSQVTVKNLENLALGKNSEKTEQTINQIKGLLIVNEERTNAIEKLFVIEKEDYTFVIQLFWRKGKLEDEKTLDRILSTFKFTN